MQINPMAQTAKLKGAVALFPTACSTVSDRVALFPTAV